MILTRFYCCFIETNLRSAVLVVTLHTVLSKLTSVGVSVEVYVMFLINRLN